MAAAAATAHSIAVNTRRRVLGDVNPQWRPDVSNYANDFTRKPLADQAGRLTLPVPDNRKNNPHPAHLAHLRRLTNEPVCTVKTVVAQSDDEGVVYSMVSSMRTHYPSQCDASCSIRSTRFGCNPKKKIPATGIVPTTPEPEVVEPERLLPACNEHTTLMATSTPFSYVPRRRKIIPQVYDEGFTLSDPQPSDTTQVGKSSPRRPSRRHVESAPQTTLQVNRFDGGAPPDHTRSITGRKKRYIPDIQLLGKAKLPPWLKGAF